MSGWRGREGENTRRGEDSKCSADMDGGDSNGHS